MHKNWATFNSVPALLGRTGHWRQALGKRAGLQQTLFLALPPILDGKSQKSWRSLSARPARATSAGSKRSNLERNKGGMFAANVPKNPYMKTSFRIKRIKALETGTWLRQSNIQTGAQYT